MAFAADVSLPLPRPQRLAVWPHPTPQHPPPSFDLPYTRCAGTCNRLLPTFPPPQRPGALRFCLPCRRAWLQQRVQRPIGAAPPLQPSVSRRIPRQHVPVEENGAVMLPSMPLSRSPPLPPLRHLYEYDPLDDPLVEVQENPASSHRAPTLGHTGGGSSTSTSSSSSSSASASPVPHGVDPGVWHAMTPRTRTWLHNDDGSRMVPQSASVMSASAFASDPKVPNDLKESLDPLCQICFVKPRNCIIDCMHYGLCMHCARQLQLCPWCRQPILRRTRKILMWVS